MKKYNRPSVELSKFDVADIITASGFVGGAAGFEAGSVEKEIYEQYVGAGGALENATVFEW